MKELAVDDQQSLLLWYDTEGLGCGVNGLPTIRLVSEIKPSYKKVDNPTYPTYIDEHDISNFAEKLTLDFVNNMFRLSSPSNILNGFISSSSITKTIS